MQFGIVFRPKNGQTVSGDGYVIVAMDGVHVVAVADGLGSGQQAARAARLALATLVEHVWTDLPNIMRQCHLALRGTRGAVMAVLKIDSARRQVSYAGVGNVDLHSQSASGFRPINAYGILGSRLPDVRAFGGAYTPGDVFVLSTDGLTRRFSLDQLPAVQGQPPQTLAEQIAAGFGRPEDDLTVLVVA